MGHRLRQPPGLAFLQTRRLPYYGAAAAAQGEGEGTRGARSDVLGPLGFIREEPNRYQFQAPHAQRVRGQ